MINKKTLGAPISESSSQGVHPLHATSFTRKLSGTPINTTALITAMYGSPDPDYPPINKEDLTVMWESVRPKLNPPPGKIIITSTPRGACHFHDLWKKNVTNKIK